MAEQVRLFNIPAVIYQHLDGNLDARECVIDVLTELRHFADEQGVDWTSADDMSELNFIEEKGEE